MPPKKIQIEEVKTLKVVLAISNEPSMGSTSFRYIEDEYTEHEHSRITESIELAKEIVENWCTRLLSASDDCTKMKMELTLILLATSDKEKFLLPAAKEDCLERLSHWCSHPNISAIGDSCTMDELVTIVTKEEMEIYDLVTVFLDAAVATEEVMENIEKMTKACLNVDLVCWTDGLEKYKGCGENAFVLMFEDTLADLPNVGLFVSSECANGKTLLDDLVSSIQVPSLPYTRMKMGSVEGKVKLINDAYVPGKDVQMSFLKSIEVIGFSTDEELALNSIIAGVEGHHFVVPDDNSDSSTVSLLSLFANSMRDVTPAQYAVCMLECNDDININIPETPPANDENQNTDKSIDWSQWKYRFLGRRVGVLWVQTEKGSLDTHLVLSIASAEANYVMDALELGDETVKDVNSYPPTPPTVLLTLVDVNKTMKLMNTELKRGNLAWMKQWTNAVRLFCKTTHVDANGQVITSIFEEKLKGWRDRSAEGSAERKAKDALKKYMEQVRNSITGEIC